jgi:hypothetical protein
VGLDWTTQYLIIWQLYCWRFKSSGMLRRAAPKHISVFRSKYVTVVKFWTWFITLCVRSVAQIQQLQMLTEERRRANCPLREKATAGVDRSSTSSHCFIYVTFWPRNYELISSCQIPDFSYRKNRFRPRKKKTAILMHSMHHILLSNAVTIIFEPKAHFHQSFPYHCT